MIGDGGVGAGRDVVSDGPSVWIGAGDGWEGASGQVDVNAGVEVDRGVSKDGSAGRGGVECDGCGEVDVTAEVDIAREVAKAGGGKKSARGVGVLK